MKHALVLAISLFASATIAAAAAAPPANPPSFPTLEQQLLAAHVIPGSALDKLIRANQNFAKLKARDAADRAVPPWLKVYWQKAHPEVDYDTDDPTGGYPLVLKEIYEWMVTHQDLKPGNSDATFGPARTFGDRDEEPDDHTLGGKLRFAALAATVGTNVRTSGAQTAARSESDIRINFWNPNKIIAASNNISSSGRQGIYYSADGGATWGQTTLPLVNGDAFHSDPTVDWTSDGTAWSITMGIDSSISYLVLRAYRSNDGGATWSFDGTISGSQTDTDKQMIWTDHSATSPYANNIYAIWHNGYQAYMTRHTSSGWGTPILVSNASQTGTCLGGDVKTNSAGDVFGFFPDTGSQGLFVVKSTNGGASYSAPVKLATTYDYYHIAIPAMDYRYAAVYISGGAYKNGTTNNVYALWTDLSGDAGCTSYIYEPDYNTASTCKTRIWFSRSTNGGTTWSAPVKINNQSGLNDQFNPFLAVDETTGTIGAIYYDTVNDPGRKKVDVFYQMSTDGGASWQTPVKVTTAMTDETTTGTNFGNQFGDYNSLSAYANVLFPSWTDRRNNGHEEIWTAKINATPTVIPRRVKYDFSGDNKGDLIWRNTLGDTWMWLMNGNASTSAQSLGTVAPPWTVAAVADFDGDGKSDMIWRNTANGDTWLWTMNAGTATNHISLGTVTPDWIIAAAADFNGDHKADLIWRNTNTGDTWIWLMSGGTATAHVSLGTVGTAWSIVGAADFNADGMADLVWRNASTGDMWLWQMNGTAVASYQPIGTLAAPWTVAAAADLDGDNKADLVVWNASTGDSWVWLMSGSSVTSHVPLGTLATSWRIAVAQDFDNDGKADLIWRNTSTGDMWMWQMNGGAVLSYRVVTNPGTAWSMALPSS